MIAKTSFDYYILKVELVSPHVVYCVLGCGTDGSLSDTAVSHHHMNGSRRKAAAGSSVGFTSGKSSHSQGMGKKSSSTSQLSATGTHIHLLLVEIALKLGFATSLSKCKFKKKRFSKNKLFFMLKLYAINF